MRSWTIYVCDEGHLALVPPRHPYNVCEHWGCDEQVRPSEVVPKADYDRAEAEVTLWKTRIVNEKAELRSRIKELQAQLDREAMK